MVQKDVDITFANNINCILLLFILLLVGGCMPIIIVLKSVPSTLDEHYL